jgi:hypothetical protein
MANDMVAIKASKLPAHLQGKVKTSNVFAAAVSAGGFPVISIKGKVFHIQRGDERTLVTKNGEDEPASSLEAIIVAVNPNKSKVFYDSGYEEGSAAKPTCYSNDGVGPAADAEEPQSKKCATCPHNQWGSRITDNGGKGKACGDSMRLAISSPSQINDPMLIRVPAASLKTLGQYGQQLAKRGVEPQHVVTRIGFDYNVAHPALTFKAVRFVEEHELEEIESVLFEEEETISQITGTAAPVMNENEHKADAAPKREYPKKSEALEKAEEIAEAAPKKRVQVEDDDEAEEVVAAPTKKVEDYDNIDEALENLDFDD